METTERKKIVIPGGSGHLGHVLANALIAGGHEVVVLSRSGRAGPRHVDATSAAPARVLQWDGKSIQEHWARVVDGADAVINLAGRSVNCRYTEGNLREMMDSRVDSTRAVGQAIAQAARAPRVWLQMSTATIYAHSFDIPNDELGGLIGGNEPNVPAYWRRSIEIATAWEAALAEAVTPGTRKVALRTAMVMSAESGGVFDVLRRLVRCGLGGPVAGGRQMVSWIHESDFVRAVEFLLARDDLDGVVNVTSPGPLPQRALMHALRAAAGIPIGLPATRWMAEIGALLLSTDTELLLKSRYVVPRRLLDAGFSFAYPEWTEAARDLMARSKSSLHPPLVNRAAGDEDEAQRRGASVAGIGSHA